MTRILIIDDEEDVRDALQLILEKAGHEVCVAADGNEGIAFLRSAQADLVITDVVMPKKDGVSTIRELRSAFPALKIIAISGGGHFGARAYQPTAINTTAYLAAAYSAGADRVFTKPFDTKLIVEAVEDLVGRGP